MDLRRLADHGGLQVPACRVLLIPVAVTGYTRSRSKLLGGDVLGDVPRHHRYSGYFYYKIELVRPRKLHVYTTVSGTPRR